jgi:hypothetical protein
MINFSKIAIKFTESLTKDMVFACVRDLMRKIGDFCYRGLEIEILFSIGTLKCKERRIKFEFDSRIVDQLSTEVDESDIMNVENNDVNNNIEDMSNNYNYNNDNDNNNENDNVTSNINTETMLNSDKSTIVPSLELSQMVEYDEDGEPLSPSSEAPLSPALHDLLMSMGPV